MSKLDRYDLRILAELQHDARISNQELAERIGLSPSPCSRRVKQLEDDGYIAIRSQRHPSMSKLDRYDLRILAELQHDARISN
ncbi:Lrp/AsnC family transcriptional regulator, partial [Acinetobacter baumannii]|uniref:Lrp/AsnC family transcriptional regulator n=1 Tax=Acinetobacter baumannii TaxID=470 RepID=UPI001D1716AA